MAYRVHFPDFFFILSIRQSFPLYGKYCISKTFEESKASKPHHDVSSQMFEG